MSIHNLCISKFGLIICVCLLFQSVVFADLKISKISKNVNSYEIVLNNDIKISNIFLMKDNFELPQYRGKSKTYKQFSILKREFRNYLLNALLHNETLIATSKISFKVNKMSIVKNKVIKSKNTIKAFASVIFEDDIEVECRIIMGKSGFWVAWPSSVQNGVRIKDFMFINRDLQRRVEEKLIADYTLIANQRATDQIL